MGFSSKATGVGFAISFSRGLPDSGLEPVPPTLQGDPLPSEPPGEPSH